MTVHQYSAWSWARGPSCPSHRNTLACSAVVEKAELIYFRRALICRRTAPNPGHHSSWKSHSHSYTPSTVHIQYLTYYLELMQRASISILIIKDYNIIGYFLLFRPLCFRLKGGNGNDTIPTSNHKPALQFSTNCRADDRTTCWVFSWS